MYSIFLYLLIIHFIADYYLQSDELANEKRMKFVGIVKHCGIYTLAAVIFAIPIWSNHIVGYFIGIAVIHFIIDSTKFMINKMEPEKCKAYEVGFYFFDQLLHIISIFIVSVLITNNEVPINFIIDVSGFAIKHNTILKSFLALILIFKPVNITFKMAYSHVKELIPEMAQSDEESVPDSSINNASADNQANQEDNQKQLNVGSIIGNLERFLVLILLSINGHSAIGLIFAAKSITRFNQIANNKEFAEYYLLGTLYSILATLIIYQSIFVWLN